MDEGGHAMLQAADYSTGGKRTLLLSAASLLLVAAMIAYPGEAYSASLQGVSLWWKFVFPGLLPSLILTELFIGLGIVHAIGVMLGPLLMKGFRLPGQAGWALASGLLGGYPAGAKAALHLQRVNMLSRQEAERITILSHMANPALIIIILGVGLLHNVQYGLLLAISHYAGAILLGLFTAKTPGANRSEANIPDNQSSLIKLALSSMRSAHRLDGRPFGKLLGDAVSSAVQTAMTIGGMIILFAVIVRTMSISGIMNILTRMMPGISYETANAAVTAVIEPHLGAFSLTQLQPVSTPLLLASLAAMLGWSGISAHAQAIGEFDGSNIRYVHFAAMRLLHSAISAGLLLLLWKPYLSLAPAFSQSAFLYFNQTGDSTSWSWINRGIWPWIPALMLINTLALLFLIAISSLFHTSKQNVRRL
jgi:sporulation integral membrane protein YlbJ